MKSALKFVCATAAILALSACVAGSGASQQAAAAGPMSLLFLGIWHGLIAPITLIIEIINRLAPHAIPWTARMYEAKGAQVEYDVGFYLGLAGGPSILFARRYRRVV